MALQISEVMDMSLDDYIASRKTVSQTSASKNEESIFKAGRRKQGSDEEEDVEESNTFGIWKGPDSSTNYLDFMSDDFEKVYNDHAVGAKKKQQNKQGNSGGHQMPNNNQTGRRFDLRNRINGNGFMEMPHVKSQQWRLMHPNTDSARPAGMPPAVPINAPLVNRQMQQWGNKNNRRNRGNRNGGWGNNRNGGLHGVGFNGGGHNNGRIQRNNAMQNVPNNNIKIIAGGFIRKDMSSSARDMTIECSSNDTNNMFLPGGKSVSSNGSRSIETPKSGDSLKALIGINDGDLQMIPLLASKFLDYFQKRSQETMHKSIYDMQIQKEIHELQGKPLMYKCSGGEVVSSDGPGINCYIAPSASGVSLNCRFA